MEQQLKKHSACDECRARKLKCSGSPSGCERCDRDKVTCVYSVQKPMGRPRKRRRGAEPAVDNEVQYPPNIPTTTAVMSVPQPIISHVEHQDSATTGLFMNQFEWLNYEFLDPVLGFGAGPPSFNPATFHITEAPRQKPTASYQNSALTLRTGEPSPFILRDAPLDIPTFGASGLACFFPGLEEIPLPASCSCLASFFATISALRIPPPPDSVSVPYALQTSSAALQAAQNSVMCQSCRASAQATYITNMLLGIQLPLLCQFYHRVLASIEATIDPQYVVMSDGQGMELDAESWQTMARTAIRKEAMKVLDFTVELEKMTASFHGVPLAKIGNITDHMGNQPLCIRVLKTIKTVAEFIVIR